MNSKHKDELYKLTLVPSPSFRILVCAGFDDERASCFYHCHIGWTSSLGRLYRVADNALEATSDYAMYQHDTRTGRRRGCWSKGSEYSISRVASHPVACLTICLGAVSQLQIVIFAIRLMLIVSYSLLAFTCLQRFMSIPKPKSEQSNSTSREVATSRKWLERFRTVNPFGTRKALSNDSITFANNYFIMALGWAIFIVICIADVYALVGRLVHTSSLYLRPRS